MLLRWQCNEGTPTRILSDGTRIEDFAIPRRHVLVLTDLEWRVTSIAGSEGLNYIVEAQLSDDVGFVSGVYLAFIELIQDRGYLSDHLTSALMLDSAVTLDNDVAAPDPRFSLFGVAPGAGEVPNCHAILRGYLARARRR
ncbi:MAG: hypothetical protein GWN37_13310 [Gammaproteobacteria bacterium]|nr:hypothetical protein [Gammaproteobacteria bacterium]